MTRGKAAAGATVAVVAGALAVTGAGVATAGQSAHAKAKGGTTVNLHADPGGFLAFNTKKLSAKAGKVTIKMMNPSTSGVDHGIAVQGKVVGKIVSPGKTSKVTLTLKAGKYTFYCPNDGHKAAGMKGTLSVK
jgi:uncharacterized cupredoxin-like copper-binding protein